MKLGELVQVIGGGTPSKKIPEYYGGDIPWASVRDMNCDVLERTEFNITQEAVENSATNVIPAGEVIISTHVGLGKVCLLAQDTAINQDLKAIIPTDSLDRKFLYYWFISQARHIVANGTGATVKGVSVDFIRNLEIPLPPLPEQRRIAAELDRIVAAKKKAEGVVAKFDLLVKARFVEMFGKCSRVVLSEYVSGFSAGKSLAGNEECRNKVLKTGAVTFDYFDSRQVKNLPVDYLPVGDHKVKTGDLLISRMNAPLLVGSCAYVWRAPEDTYLPDRLWRVTIKNNANPIFLWKALIQPEAKREIHGCAAGTSGSMKNISKEKMLRVTVPHVDISLQREFAAFVEKAEKSKAAARRAVARFDQLYRSKLQEYFA